MENEYRRSGFDRRKKVVLVDYDRRKSKERRSVIKDSSYITDFFKSIPVFKGLNDKQYREILNVCRQITVPENHTLFKNGDESNEIYILLWGQLKVLSEDQSMIAYLTPVGSIGEIGVLCGMNHNVEVVSTIESRVIIINKSEFLWMLTYDYELSTIIYRNALKDIVFSLNEKTEVLKTLAKDNKPIIL